MRVKSFKFTDSSNNDKNLGGTDVDGTIDHANNTITLELPSGVTMDTGAIANTVTLKPTIVLGGDDTTTVSPNTETSTQFTIDGSTAVEYTVTGADGMTKTYKITVSKASSSG
ncbi:hypothetical protein [Ichthyobacterium seriolicida]|uniref:Cadherin-like beta sandwich domain-containing protein n=1 Tax=Ichthyobacterium seriolicida TaxID=242600 RepID=A0A1J1E9W9_9FLAO|nr:hypothetical protein [Ichthyobacterium seriolicida]BAV94715.1 hypothetical protein JBKA6_0702 [Ichthyobacterium seriolicida]